jgi:hypothetical protein
MITLYDDPEVWLNLSFSVGRPGFNRKDDVMLVQALFNFVAERHSSSVSVLGIGQVDLPRVTGEIDGATIFAIQWFQLRWVRFMRMIDRTMRPARYEGDLDLSKRMEPITMLVSLARDADPFHYTQTILSDFPTLRSFAQLDMMMTLK